MNASPEIIVMSSKDDTGNGTTILVEDYDTIVLSFTTKDNANLTALVQGSIQQALPSWDDDPSATNQHEYVQMKDLEDGSTKDGDAGFSVSGTDDNKMYEVNTNGLRWINVNISAISAGSITVRAKGFTRS